MIFEPPVRISPPLARDLSSNMILSFRVFIIP